MSDNIEISDEGEGLFRSLIDAAEELRGLWHKCSAHPALLREHVTLTIDLRRYTGGPTLEMSVDAESVSGKAFAWCLDVRRRSQLWTVERSVRLNDSNGQHVIIDLGCKEFVSSRALIQHLLPLVSPGIGFHWTLIWAKFMAMRVSYATEERYEH